MLVLSLFFLGRFRRRCGKKWIKGWTTQMPSFLFTRRDTRAVQIAQLITHIAAIRARKNNSGRYQCFFNRFNPVWCGLKKLRNQTNQKRFFTNRTRNNSTNPTNLKRLIPIEHALSLPRRHSLGFSRNFREEKDSAWRAQRMSARDASHPTADENNMQ